VHRASGSVMEDVQPYCSAQELPHSPKLADIDFRYRLSISGHREEHQH